MCWIFQKINKTITKVCLKYIIEKQQERETEIEGI